ncbi:hypothetical protein [Burkholderia sp. Ed8]|uniref:hypothetical protein n=1 Tax=Burkholderia sp. Ed8 TaxID=3112957 RepID=UPI00345CFA27
MIDLKERVGVAMSVRGQFTDPIADPKRPVQKLRRGVVYFLGKLLTLGIRTREVQGWKRQSLTTNCGY